LVKSLVHEFESRDDWDAASLEDPEEAKMLSARGLSRSLIKGFSSSASARLISSATCSVIRFSRPTFVAGGGMGIHGVVQGFGQRAMASDAKGEKGSKKNMKDMRTDAKVGVGSFGSQHSAFGCNFLH